LPQAALHEDPAKPLAAIAATTIAILSLLDYASGNKGRAIMDKHQVAAILDDIGTLLELQGENSFRTNTYHNGARIVEQLTEELSDLITQNRLGDVRGIGDSLKEKITTLVTTGKLPYYDDLRKKFPPGLFDMLRVGGLGPKKVKTLWQDLGIDSLDKLKAACESGEVAKLKGFGAKTQEKILEGIEFLQLTGNRVRIDQALPLALNVMGIMRKLPGIQRIELCGSLRRRRETIKDMDILISSAHPAPIMQSFVSLPDVVQVTGHGDTKSSVVFNVGTAAKPQYINADLRVVPDDIFAFALHHFTGSKDHNVRMRSRAQTMGLKLSEYGLVGDKKDHKCKTEEEIFKALGLSYIPPEMREDTGEVDAAEKGPIARLVEVGDIQGVFHNHTTASDGKATLEEMAHAAKKLGLKYLGIGDHSQSLTIANGLNPARVKKQQAEIDALNAKTKGFHVFKGTECDILADGTLDFPDDVLETFDYVVASVHLYTKQTKEEMTARIIKAIRNPHVTMLGHATGRLLLQRDAYPVDLEAVLQEAAKHHKMIEINAQPSRLDLDWVHCKRAKALGVTLVINPDAHSTEELGLYPFGVDVARRGWLEKENVFNTLTLEQVKKRFHARTK
jgi:DNA polymerase (family 10)